MNEYFVSNRDVIKNFSFNTGTTSTPVYTTMCTATELSLNTDKLPLFSNTAYFTFSILFTP